MAKKESRVRVDMNWSSSGKMDLPRESWYVWERTELGWVFVQIDSQRRFADDDRFSYLTEAQHLAVLAADDTEYEAAHD